jgi:hypothetical protein
VDRLRRITREGDRPDREDSPHDGSRRRPADGHGEHEEGEGHIDIRV